jgi:hypothetical protein
MKKIAFFLCVALTPFYTKAQEWPASNVDSLLFGYRIILQDSLLEHQQKLLTDIQDYFLKKKEKEEGYSKLEEMILNKRIYPYQVKHGLIRILIDQEAYSSLCNILDYYSYNSFYSVRPSDTANYPTVFVFSKHANERQRRAFLDYILETDCIDYRQITRRYDEVGIRYSNHYIAMEFLFARDTYTREVLQAYADKRGNRFRRKFLRKLLEN